MENLREKLNKHFNTYTLDSISNEDIPLLTATFIIPAINSGETIAPVMEAIYKQSYKDQIKEVIVVDDASTDNTKQQVLYLKQIYKGDLNIKLLTNRSRRYSAYCRNKGLTNATGDIICFIDSDIIIPPDYLEKHLSVHQKVCNCITFSFRKDTELLNYKDLIFPIEGKTNDFREAIVENNNDLQNCFFTLGSHTLADLCLTCAVTYKRATLLKVKGCPNNFVGWGYNDTAIAAKVISLDTLVIPLKNVSVYHKKHQARSGNDEEKMKEYLANRKRYEMLLNLPINKTFHFNIKSLDIYGRANIGV
ncbi:MAG: glycosyltransferase family A protein [Candidatus Dojkabacteria bacterium]|nr:MAG: glycosyltransferase family A protein [Candidatus Dojkabacteria bacterium]